MIKKFISVVGFSLFLFCNSGDAPSDCTPITDSDKNVELIYPKGGETFKVGQQIPVKWKVNDKNVEVVLEVSDGSSWKTLTKEAMQVTGPCMDTVWTIGTQFQTVDLSKGHLSLRVYGYQTGEADASGEFTITQ